MRTMRYKGTNAMACHEKALWWASEADTRTSPAPRGAVVCSVCLLCCPPSHSELVLLPTAAAAAAVPSEPFQRALEKL